MSGEKARWVIGVVCLLLAGCASTTVGSNIPDASTKPLLATETQVSTEDANMATSWARYRAAQTLAAQETTTPRPTVVATATPTPYPEANLPDAPLSQDGPWLIFMAATEQTGPDYLWAINDNGTGLTQLVDEPVLTFATQPIESLEEGAIIAYVTQSGPDVADLTLKTITLPGGEIETIAALIDQAKTTDVLDVYLISVAVRWGGLSWSSDGRRLAFVSALDGPSIDVYTYDISGQAVTRLSNSPEQAYWLAWSPDNRYVVHEVFPFMEMGGPLSSGLWAARADGSGAVPLLVGDAFNRDVSYNWLSPTEMLITNGSYGESESEILRVNIATGRIQYVFRGPYSGAAYAQGHDTWLLSSWTPEREPLFVLIRRGERIEMPGRGVYQISWSEAQGVFIVKPHPGDRFTLSPQGEIKSDPRPEWLGLETEYSTYPSPDNTLRAWSFYAPQSASLELCVGEPTGEPILVLADANREIGGITWSPDSRRLMILTYQGLLMAEHPDFRPLLVAGGLYIRGSFNEGDEWIPGPAPRDGEPDE